MIDPEICPWNPEFVAILDEFERVHNGDVEPDIVFDDNYHSLSDVFDAIIFSEERVR